MRPLDPRVLTHLRPATRALLGVLAGGTLGGFLTVAQAFAIGTVLVRVVGGADWHPAAWWLVGITVARAAAAYAVDVASATAASQVSLALRHRLLRATLDLEAQDLSRHRSGELTLLATRGMTAVEPYLTRYLPTFVMATVLPAAALVAIWWLDWLSGLIVLLTLPLVPVFAILIGYATQDRADKQWKLLATLSGHFLDVVRGLPTLVAFRRAGAQATSIRRITDRYREATIETLKLAFLSSGALELIATISVALVAVNVGLRLAAGNVDFWTAMVVLLLAPEAYWPLRRVGAEFHSAAEGTAAFEQASALLGDGAPVASARGTATPLPGAALTVSDLTVRYPDRDLAAITGLSATFPSPGLSAVAGPSGSGKSTLLAVLLGELAPESGQVGVGDHTLGELDRDRWRASVSWSPQRPWLFAGTLADNLRLGRPDATDEQLWAALDGVALSDVVRSLPAGLETELGEDGAGLSAGQRARLALARVVVADRPYVFLDEPTAHLDATTEAVLLDTLRTLSRTSCVIVVAHRPAVVEAADHVVTLTSPLHADPADSLPGRGQASAEPADSLPGRDQMSADPAENLPGRAEEPAVAWWTGARMGTFLGAMSVASGVALTATASWLITRASEQPPVLYLLVAIVAVRTFGLGRPVLRYAERIVSHDAALRLLAERRAQVYDAIVPLVPGKLGSKRGDVLTSVVDDVDSLVDRQLRVRQPLWTALIVGLMAVALASALDLRGGLVIALSSSFSALGGLLTWRGVAAAEPAFVSRRAALSARVEEIVRSARDLVLWGADDRALARLDEAGRQLGSATRRSATAVALGRLLPVLGGGLGLLGIALFVPRGATSDALLALLVLLPIALVDAFAPLPDAGALAVRTSAAQARLDALARQTPLVTETENPTSAELTAPTAAARSISVGWGDTDALVDFDLDLAPGARIGLVGASGTGKSTYAAVMMRFLDPRSGAQTLADTDLRQLTFDDVRRTTGLVDDDPHIFASNVAENVRLARPEASDADVRAALDAAHLGDWLDGLPRGMSTMIGEGSAHVSGGERARIALARALLADQPVLVLDEPTAHLDADTARRVSDEVLGEERGRSIVWITHGTIGLDAMDTVIRLEG